MDRFHVKGMDSACGYVSWLGSPKKSDDEGLLVDRLHSLGAVIFCKTNVPMSSMVSWILAVVIYEVADVLFLFLDGGDR